jgi:hypothetical protein
MSRCPAIVRIVLVAGSLAVSVFTDGGEAGVDCNDEAQDRQVTQALESIARQVDPCGETAEILQLLERVRTCQHARYRICVDSRARRNLFNRPAEATSRAPRTIVWNPGLAEEIERGCRGDADTPVLRDPLASLVHELAHAAQDCDGSDPTENELEAVRLENIYRRAAGLCQRSGYGRDRLPPSMTRDCEPALPSALLRTGMAG